MTAWLLLLLALAVNTAVWPVGRWALADTGRPGVMGLWTSATVMAASLLWLARAGMPPQATDLRLAGLLMGVAYAIGFMLLIMHALRIGPAGPTATINNCGLLGGVLYDLVWVQPRVPTPAVLSGIAGILAAFVCIGLGDRNRPGPIDRRWWPTVTAGGLFSVLSFTCQTHVGLHHPGPISTFGFTLWGFGIAAVILLVVSIARRQRHHTARERIGGITIGLLTLTAMLSSLHIMPHFGAAVVLTATIAIPMVLTLLIGRLCYGERLRPLTAWGCALATVAVIALALGAVPPEPAP